jgi:hypothetical protein
MLISSPHGKRKGIAKQIPTFAESPDLSASVPEVELEGA